MIKTLWTLFLLWFPTAVKGIQTNQMGNVELARLKMSLMYVRSIKTFRLLFLSLLSIGVCLVLLLTGIVLFHVSLFLYAPWSVETKMIVGIACSIVYLGVTFALVYKIFDSDNWLQIFHAQGIIEELKSRADAEHKDIERTDEQGT